MASLNLVPLPQHEPPVHKCLFHGLILGHARGYSQVTRVSSTIISYIHIFLTSPWISLLYIFNQMVSSHFSLKTTNQTRTLNFHLILSNWHSNTCHIYLQVALLRSFLNTFKTIFTRIFLQMDSHNCFNFIPILYKVTSHVELHISLEWFAF
jgi:hypothetical protein